MDLNNVMQIRVYEKAVYFLRVYVCVCVGGGGGFKYSVSTRNVDLYIKLQNI